MRGNPRFGYAFVEKTYRWFFPAKASPREGVSGRERQSGVVLPLRSVQKQLNAISCRSRGGGSEDGCEIAMEIRVVDLSRQY